MDEQANLTMEAGAGSAVEASGSSSRKLSRTRNSPTDTTSMFRPDAPVHILDKCTSFWSLVVTRRGDEARCPNIGQLLFRISTPSPGVPSKCVKLKLGAGMLVRFVFFTMQLPIRRRPWKVSRMLQFHDDIGIRL